MHRPPLPLYNHPTAGAPGLGPPQHVTSGDGSRGPMLLNTTGPILLKTDSLARIRDRTGVPVARQLRRAVDEYLDQHENPAALRAPGATPSPTTPSRGGSQP